ncbi:MAG: hypothetical protein JWP78_1011 [Mucilaginibacter sp.]|nr:hypothetical protein [Mucilaginibacter sp.]
MVKSILPKAKQAFINLLILLSIAFGYGFSRGMSEKDWLEWSNKCLTESFDPSTDSKLKKWEIMLTPGHFIRFRKTYQHGNQEYYSFSLNKLDSVNYLGTTTAGRLRFKTIADDIIVQTYDDPKGNIDSMATALSIPVKNISPERLDSLNNAITYFKDKKL